jgi:hypothetical protein
MRSGVNGKHGVSKDGLALIIPPSASVTSAMDKRSSRRLGNLIQKTAATGREVYEDRDARISIVARNSSFRKKAEYIEADRSAHRRPIMLADRGRAIHFLNVSASPAFWAWWRGRAESLR